MSDSVIKLRDISEKDLDAALAIECELRALPLLSGRGESPQEHGRFAPLLAIGTGFAAIGLAALVYNHLPGW